MELEVEGLDTEGLDYDRQGAVLSRYLEALDVELVSLDTEDLNYDRQRPVLSRRLLFPSLKEKISYYLVGENLN
jgi:hypothetical protein